MLDQPVVEQLDLHRISPADEVRFRELASRVWPPELSRNHLPEYASAPAPQHNSPPQQRPRSFIVRDPGGIMIANATVNPRLIRTSAGQLTVLALAAVLSAPEHRGQGLGRAVVQAAFALVDQGSFPCALFQTAVPDFYHKLGARIVSNPIINSLGQQPDHRPFWDDWAMVYPASFQFAPGPIDTLGPGW